MLLDAKTPGMTTVVPAQIVWHPYEETGLDQVELDDAFVDRCSWSDWESIMHNSTWFTDVELRRYLTMGAAISGRHIPSKTVKIDQLTTKMMAKYIVNTTTKVDVSSTNLVPINGFVGKQDAIDQFSALWEAIEYCFPKYNAYGISITLGSMVQWTNDGEVQVTGREWRLFDTSEIKAIYTVKCLIDGSQCPQGLLAYTPMTSWLYKALTGNPVPV